MKNNKRYIQSRKRFSRSWTTWEIAAWVRDPLYSRDDQAETVLLDQDGKLLDRAELKRCANCQHWHIHNMVSNAEVEALGNDPHQYQHIGKCDAPGVWVFDLVQHIAIRRGLASADLMTHEDFLCVLFEARCPSPEQD